MPTHNRKKCKTNPKYLILPFSRHIPDRNHKKEYHRKTKMSNRATLTCSFPNTAIIGDGAGNVSMKRTFVITQGAQQTSEFLIGERNNIKAGTTI